MENSGQKIKIATVCSGIGSPEQALKELDIPHEISFACEIDKYARQTYLANFTPNQMYTDLTAEEWDKSEQYSDLFIGGIPCQAFSLAGKRLGELDKRGLLFYDFYRYVKNQQPKVFIIENVKGLLSDNNGVTFQNWCALLGQSMNTHLNMFNHDDSLLYNLHFKVLNSKDFGVPQNRERVFLIGIRNDLPNNFRFPIGERLKIRLKDILESIVDEKYYLSEKMIECLDKRKGTTYDTFYPADLEGNARTVNARIAKMGSADNYIQESIIKIGQTSTENSQAGKVYDSKGISPTVCAGTHGYAIGYIQEPYCVAMRGRNPENPSDRTTGANTEQRLEPNSHGITNTITSVQKDNLIVVKEATKQGYAIAKEGDSINLSNPNSETRRGRVGNQIANTLDTACNQAVVVNDLEIINPLKDKTEFGWHFEQNVFSDESITRALKSSEGSGNKQKVILNQRIRRLTPLECMRLQGYPDSYIKPCSDSQTYKQAGNSITVNVMKAIIKNLIPVL
jgi:DNA (cytosine-5)-methyltransferase 1